MPMGEICSAVPSTAKLCLFPSSDPLSQPSSVVLEDMHSAAPWPVPDMLVASWNKEMKQHNKEEGVGALV